MKAFPRPWYVIQAGTKVGIRCKDGRIVGWINKGEAETPREAAEFIVKAVNAMPDI